MILVRNRCDLLLQLVGVPEIMVPEHEMAHELRRVTDEFEQRWRRGEKPDVRALLEGRESPERETVLQELVLLELALRREVGEQPAAAEFTERFPELADFLNWVFATSVRLGTMHRQDA